MLAELNSRERTAGNHARLLNQAGYRLPGAIPAPGAALGYPWTVEAVHQ